MSDAADEPTLTPVEVRSLDALRRSGEPLMYDSDLIADVRTEMCVSLDEAMTCFTDEEHGIGISRLDDDGRSSSHLRLPDEDDPPDVTSRQLTGQARAPGCRYEQMAW